MGALFEMFSRTFQSLSQSILQMKGTEQYLLRSKVLQLKNVLPLEENLKNILSSFHVAQSIELQLFKV